MKLTTSELDFLAAWAREEWEPECYKLPAHRLQLAHGVSGASLIVFIKAWTGAEQRKDQDILQMSANREPAWPWSAAEQFETRLEEARSPRATHPWQPSAEKNAAPGLTAPR